MKLNIQLNANNSVIRNIETKQDECMSTIQIVRSTAHATYIIDQLEDAVRSQEEMIQVLPYTSIDTEARSRRNNMPRHELNFMDNELDIDTSEMCIERAHILGSLRQDTFRGRSDPRRPIIVKQLTRQRKHIKIQKH